MEITPVEILGLIAGFLTAFSSMPQTVKIIRLRKAESVSALTYFMLIGSYALWLTYGVIENSISIVFWNVIALLLGSTVLFLKLFVWKEK